MILRLKYLFTGLALITCGKLFATMTATCTKVVPVITGGGTCADLTNTYCYNVSDKISTFLNVNVTSTGSHRVQTRLVRPNQTVYNGNIFSWSGSSAIWQWNWDLPFTNINPQTGKYVVQFFGDENNSGWKLLGEININVLSNPITDYNALMALYSSTNGSGWKNKTGWVDGAAGTNCDYCNWYGVTCDGNGRVSNLNLEKNQLIGTIAPEISSLSQLSYLRLNDNQLSGTIPTQIRLLSNLTGLILGNNQLTGSIPPQLGSLPNLTGLWLDNNKLTGAIPIELASLPNLTALILGKNQFNGSIPSQLGSISKLTDLWLDNNQLTGSIPTQIRSLSNLKNLILSNNQFTGPIPLQLGSLSNLTDLWLTRNRLSGTIPIQLGSLTKIVNLVVRDNQFSGSIPNNLGLLSNIKVIDFANNNLSGCIPQNLHEKCSIRLILSNNPLLPYEGDSTQFCSLPTGSFAEQIGASCNDKLAFTTNDKINTSCECKGELTSEYTCIPWISSSINAIASECGKILCTGLNSNRPVNYEYGTFEYNSTQYIYLQKTGGEANFPCDVTKYYSLDGTLVGECTPFSCDETKPLRINLGEFNDLAKVPFWTCSMPLPSCCPTEYTIKYPTDACQGQLTDFDITHNGNSGQLYNIIVKEGNNFYGNTNGTGSSFKVSNDNIPIGSHTFDANISAGGITCPNITKSTLSSQNLIVHDISSKLILPSQPVCAGSTIKATIEVSPTPTANPPYNATIDYSSPSGKSFSLNKISNNTTIDFDIPLEEIGDYGFSSRVMDGNNCSGITLLVVYNLKVNPRPTISINGNSAVCNGQSFQLSTSSSSGIPPYTYKWNNGSTSSAINVSPTENTNYSVTITDGNQCTTSAKKDLTVSQSLKITSALMDQNICIGNVTTLTVAVDGGVGTKTYQWQESNSCGGNFTNIAGANSSSYITPVLSSTKYYRVIIDDGVGNCDQVVSNCITITVGSNTTPTITYVDSSFCNNIIASGFPILNGIRGGIFSANNGLNINSIDGSFNPSTSLAGSYTITYNPPTGGGCPSSPATTKIKIIETPSRPDFITPPAVLCESIKDTLYLSKSYLQYKWDNQSTNSFREVFGDGLGLKSYRITVTDDGGCTASNSIDILNDKGVDFNSNPIGTSVDIKIISGTKPFDIQWQGAITGNAIEVDSNNYTIKDLVSGTYNIKVTSKNGCFVEKNVKIGSSACPHPDYDALMALYNSTNGDMWKNSGTITNPKDTTAGWGKDCDPCKWWGVKCDGNSRALELDLFNNNLVGNIPNAIGNFSFLKILDLGNNNINGSLPNEIGNLDSLLQLFLARNSIQGVIPSSLGKLKSIINISMWGNQLNGTLPKEIGSLTKLKSLEISNNKLSGSIPIEIGGMSAIESIFLLGNQLSGTLPVEMANLNKLKILDLEENKISGNLPSDFGNLSTSVILRLN